MLRSRSDSQHATRSLSRMCLIASLGLAGLAGCAGISANHQPTELTRRQAAGQFVCHEQDITVKELGNAEVQATGCGKTATWSCSGNTDGHSAEEILDRHCSRVTQITSEYGTPPASKAKNVNPREESKKSAAGSEDGAALTPLPVMFPRDDAKTALRAAQGGLRSCRAIASDFSPLEATLRFEPSGKVSRVDVAPPTANAETASCVRSRLAEISIPKFTGDPVIVKMPVRF